MQGRREDLVFFNLLVESAAADAEFFCHLSGSEKPAHEFLILNLDYVVASLIFVVDTFFFI